jgi:hypothetical protein
MYVRAVISYAPADERPQNASGCILIHSKEYFRTHVTVTGEADIEALKAAIRDADYEILEG